MQNNGECSQLTTEQCLPVLSLWSGVTVDLSTVKTRLGTIFHIKAETLLLLNTTV